MSDRLSPYANRVTKTKTPKPSAGIGGAGCDCGGSAGGSGDDPNCYNQRIPVDLAVPAVDPLPASGYRDLVIAVDHRGDWFEARKLFLEARNTDGSVNTTSYIRAYEIDEDRQDCIASDTARGLPVHAFSGQGGCCDGLPVCINKFANNKERKSLKIHVRIYGMGDGGYLSGYLTGRCRECGYEKLCNVPSTAA